MRGNKLIFLLKNFFFFVIFQDLSQDSCSVCSDDESFIGGELPNMMGGCHFLDEKVTAGNASGGDGLANGDGTDNGGASVKNVASADADMADG